MCSWKNRLPFTGKRIMIIILSKNVKTDSWGGEMKEKQGEIKKSTVSMAVVFKLTALMRRLKLWIIKIYRPSGKSTRYGFLLVLGLVSQIKPRNRVVARNYSRKILDVISEWPPSKLTFSRRRGGGLSKPPSIYLKVYPYPRGWDTPKNPYFRGCHFAGL